MTGAIDLSKLPAVDFTPQLTIEQITAEAITWLADNEGDIIEGPGDPRYRLIRSLAVRERLLRQASNEAHKNRTLAYGRGAALDHTGTTYHHTERLLNETDDDYRHRCALAPEGYSTAGPIGAYLFHAKSASENVKDVEFISPQPLDVILPVLSTEGDGTANQALLNSVAHAVNQDHVRPQGDRVTVQSAEILTYSISGTVHTYPGPDHNIVKAAALKALQTYTKEEHRLQGIVSDSGIKAHTHLPGVAYVALNNWADIFAEKHQAPYCTAITLTVKEVM
ncbi:Uncharacterised protein [BD1-7 clade bacterium]|uniref:Baseplate J-like central domain-containing protein n=1 Tax=BD1-7 clade bacterium TaxID=2029982 RepID=A0A5S9P369_9GAMM|nr:Uncharacterised protein [BD1-7 clade bacterium]CAA0122844.1 Uncharacterised protein [BD1-7 clade bacterium]